MLRWLKQRLRPPLPAGEPYSTEPTPENLYQLLRKRCPVCGLDPPDWLEGDRPEDAICIRCSARYIVHPGTKLAHRGHF